MGFWRSPIHPFHCNPCRPCHSYRRWKLDSALPPRPHAMPYRGGVVGSAGGQQVGRLYITNRPQGDAG